MHMPLIEVWDPGVSGDLIGLAMALLAALVALALLVPSVRALVRGRRGRRA
jgi:hypothetical protein